jgi:hypothetical protein
MVKVLSEILNIAHPLNLKSLELPRDRVQRERVTYSDTAGSNSMHSVRDLYPILNKTEKSKSLPFKGYNDISYFDNIHSVHFD